MSLIRTFVIEIVSRTLLSGSRMGNQISHIIVLVHVHTFTIRHYALDG